MNKEKYNIEYRPIKKGDFVIGLKSQEPGFSEPIEFFVLDRKLINKKKTLTGTKKIYSYKIFSLKDGFITLETKNIKIKKLISS